MQRRRFLRAVAGAMGVSPLVARTVAAAPKAHNIRVNFDRGASLHPALQYAAVAQPDQRIRVLVQTQSGSVNGDAIARSVGAVHIEEMGFINSHILELTPRQLTALAQHRNVRYISPDAPVSHHSLSATTLKTLYPAETNATQLWDAKTSGLQATGKGVTVAVLDTGIAEHPDLKDDIHAVKTNDNARTARDHHGHGTHIAGIITGTAKNGSYVGVAPDADLIGIKISDDVGHSYTSDLLRGLQWVSDHRERYDIRVINLSVSSSIAESYITSPLAAAVEQLWRSGVVVVVAAGNDGIVRDAMFHAPANDPYVITVGALDDNATADPGDDIVASWSSRGITQDKIAKPEILAPGRKIVSTLAGPSCTLAKTFASRITDDHYIRLSGTSMAAPVVSGIVALLLERHPHLAPDQVKWLLTKSAKAVNGGVTVDALTAMTLAQAGNVGSANRGLKPSLAWNTKGGSVGWSEVYWDEVYWDEVYWDEVYWDEVYWDEVYWD